MTERNEMVEAVARALAIADGKDPDAPAWVRSPSGETFGICWRDQYSKKARAAIAAMEKPTNEMLEGACSDHEVGKPMSPKTDEECPFFRTRRRIWREMIDEALKP